MNPFALPTPVFDKALLHSDPQGAARQFFAERQKWFASAVEPDCDSLVVCLANTLMVDGFIRRLFEMTEERLDPKGRRAVVALGGLGRCELGLHCDIDLMFLHEANSPECLQKLADGILYPLWNSNIEAGGATRTISDCREIVEKDIRALTALLEARFVGGDESLYVELCQMVAKYFSDPRTRRDFMEKKIAERSANMARFGDSIYLAQPNLKEGFGGLRDFHTLLWVARAAWHACPSENPIPMGDDDFKFIWRIRHGLHLIEGKRTDRITDALQGPVAKLLGFTGTDGESAAEQMMSEYYRHATELHFKCEREIEKIRRMASPAGRVKNFFLQKKLAGTSSAQKIKLFLRRRGH